MQETVQIEIGPRPSHSDRHDPISVAGQAVDALQALQKLDPSAPLIYDESIPHQVFPAPGERAWWLVPIGYVRWQPVQNGAGYFLPRDDSDPARRDTDAIARFRRMAGVVAEAFEAADGAIRLRDRSKDPDDLTNTRFSKNPPQGFLTKDPSKGYYQPPGPDLVWVEGHLRVEGDARITRGRLDFRAADGEDHDTPLALQRTGDAGKAPNQTGGRALQVLLGPAAQTDNRFAVGPLKDDGSLEERLAVLSGGNVGIGTSTPGLKLDIQGDFGRDNGAATAHLWGSRVGDIGGGILFLRSGGGVVAFDGDDSVGIGTNAPNRALTVQGKAGTYLNVKADGGAEEVLLGADAGGGIVSTMTNHDLQLRAGGNVTRMTVKADGRVGIGTATPSLMLSVEGDFGRDSGPATLSLWGSRIGDTGGGLLFLRAFTGGVVGFDGIDNRVGVGTTLPTTKLQVVGDRIRLGTGTKRIDLRVDGGAVDLHSETHDLYLRSSGGAGSNRIILNPFAGDGNVGVGTTSPSVKLHIVGDLTVDGIPRSTTGSFWTLISDARLKRDVEPISGALQRLLRLRGVSFHWKDAERARGRPGPHMGLVAQEVEPVFPEWVGTGPDGDKELTLQGFEAVVIEALRDLKAEVDGLAARLESLERRSGEQHA